MAKETNNRRDKAVMISHGAEIWPSDIVGMNYHFGRMPVALLAQLEATAETPMFKQTFQSHGSQSFMKESERTISDSP